MFIYPYKPGSKSARNLARALGAKRIKHQGSKFKPGPNKTVINWGSANYPGELDLCRVLNNRHEVASATNKLEAFRIFEEQGVRTPEWTERILEATHWSGEGETILARTKLRGHSGDGIIVIEPEGQQFMPKAPLYVKYKKAKSEWRVHVGGEQWIQIDRKVKDPEREVKDWKVRSHQNGFIYQRNNEFVPQDVIEQAHLAIHALGLDFGAVDVLWNEHEEKAYVLEVNCAPGLVGQTLQNYVKYFTNLPQ